MNPLKKATAKLIFGAILLERLEKDHRASANFFTYRLLHRIDVNIEISSRTVNCQQYQVKEPKNNFRCSLSTNCAAKQTQSIVYICYHMGIFGAKTNAVARVSAPFSGLNVNTCVF